MLASSYKVFCVYCFLWWYFVIKIILLEIWVVSAALTMPAGSFITVLNFSQDDPLIQGTLQSACHLNSRLGGPYTHAPSYLLKKPDVLRGNFFKITFSYSYSFKTLASQRRERGERCILLFHTWEDSSIYIFMKVFHKVVRRAILSFAVFLFVS